MLALDRLWVSKAVAVLGMGWVGLAHPSLWNVQGKPTLILQQSLWSKCRKPDYFSISASQTAADANVAVAKCYTVEFSYA